MTDPKGRKTQSSNTTDLTDLGRRLEIVNAKRNPEVEVSQTSGSNLAEGLKYASEFSAAVMVGAALGWAVDKVTKTSPWGLLVGLFFGFCAGVMTVVRAAREGADGSGDDLPPDADEDEDR